MDDNLEITVPAEHVRFEWFGALPGVPLAHVLVPRDLVVMTATDISLNGV